LALAASLHLQGVSGGASDLAEEDRGLLQDLLKKSFAELYVASPEMKGEEGDASGAT